MNAEERLKIEEKVVEMLHTVYDPEIPVDIYELGLVYKIDLDDDGNLVVDMTLTAPNCPMADFILEDGVWLLPNQPITLPSTGGIGITIFYTIGILLILSSTFFIGYFLYKKRKKY